MVELALAVVSCFWMDRVVLVLGPVPFTGADRAVTASLYDE